MISSDGLRLLMSGAGCRSPGRCGRDDPLPAAIFDQTARRLLEVARSGRRAGPAAPRPRRSGPGRRAASGSGRRSRCRLLPRPAWRAAGGAGCRGCWRPAAARARRGPCPGRPRRHRPAPGRSPRRAAATSRRPPGRSSRSWCWSRVKQPVELVALEVQLGQPADDVELVVEVLGLVEGPPVHLDRFLGPVLAGEGLGEGQDDLGVVGVDAHGAAEGVEPLLGPARAGSRAGRRTRSARGCPARRPAGRGRP